jgi:hypothetical protein
MKAEVLTPLIVEITVRGALQWEQPRSKIPRPSAESPTKKKTESAYFIATFASLESRKISLYFLVVIIRSENNRNNKKLIIVTKNMLPIGAPTF